MLCSASSQFAATAAGEVAGQDGSLVVVLRMKRTEVETAPVVVAGSGEVEVQLDSELAAVQYKSFRPQQDCWVYENGSKGRGQKVDGVVEGCNRLGAAGCTPLIVAPQACGHSIVQRWIVWREDPGAYHACS